MKKTLAVVAVAALCAVLATMSAGCSSDSDVSDVDYTGLWVLYAMQDDDGTVTTAESLGDLYAPEDIAYLELGSDGSVQFVIMGSDMFESLDASWTAVSTGIQIEDSSGDLYTVVYNADDGTLEIESDGQIIWFARETASTDDSAEDSDESADSAETADESESADASSE